MLIYIHAYIYTYFYIYTYTYIYLYIYIHIINIYIHVVETCGKSSIKLTFTYYSLWSDHIPWRAFDHAGCSSGPQKPAALVQVCCSVLQCFAVCCSLDHEGCSFGPGKLAAMVQVWCSVFCSAMHCVWQCAGLSTMRAATENPAALLHILKS